MSASVPRPHKATLQDALRAMERDERVEFYDGELVQKVAPLPFHGGAQVEVGTVLAPFRRKDPPGGVAWWVLSEVETEYPDGRHIFRHDLTGWRKDLHPSFPNETPVRLVPNWASEVLSPSTARYDTVQKQRVLHRHNVGHYWLVNPEHQTLTVMRHSPDGYVVVLTASPGMTVRAEPFEALEFPVSDLFGVD
jgi:Uma2 family endonuclease